MFAIESSMVQLNSRLDTAEERINELRRSHLHKDLDKMKE
jgi:hypothetical protein